MVYLGTGSRVTREGEEERMKKMSKKKGIER